MDFVVSSPFRPILLTYFVIGFVPKQLNCPLNSFASSFMIKG